MPIEVATLIARALEGYVILGFGFALWFAVAGAGRIDPVARRGTLGFRLLLLPGATLLWPWLAVTLLRARTDGGVR